ncbi:hypothetical protein TNCV_2089141 [Trichonephila clavipes]|nr:hypothetical protein TNCV_2089141 [Trichonephila clavipes]
MSSTYRYAVSASNDDQRDPAIKINGSPDHNIWLRACEACNSENRIGTLPWLSPDTSSMIVRTQMEAGLIAKHYTSPSVFNGYPYHHNGCTDRMVVSNASRPGTFSLVPPDMDMSIMMLHSEPGSVFKDGVVLFTVSNPCGYYTCTINKPTS